MTRVRAPARAFVLHDRLAADTLFISNLGLSRILLMNDARFPWIILVPRRPRLQEIFDLTVPDRNALVREVAFCSKRLKSTVGAAKINVGALGNMVPQLHVHIVARQPDDVAWPHPVWSFGKAMRYSPAARAAMLRRLRVALSAR